MSRDLKTILLIAVAPFLAFWGWQVGVCSANLLVGDDVQTFSVTPSHFGWYVAGLSLVSIKLMAMFANATHRWVLRWIREDQTSH